MGDFLVPGLVLAALGLWWALAPDSAVRFYRRLGNKHFEWVGPGMVRAFGVVLLVVIATAAAGLRLR